MFHEVAEEPGELSPEELYALYESELIEAIEAEGAEAVAAEAGVDVETIEALAAGESPEVTLEEAAAILAVLDEYPDADTIVALSRDALMMGMSSAILDVEALARQTEGQLEAREVQAKVEGRFPISLREFATLHQIIDERSR